MRCLLVVLMIPMIDTISLIPVKTKLVRHLNCYQLLTPYRREAVSVLVSLHFLVFQVRDKERVWPPAGTFVLGQPRHKLSVRGLLWGPGASLVMVNKNSLMKSNV